MKKLLLPLLISILPITTNAGKLSDSPVVYRSGAWAVHKTIDPMTDKASCTGIYNNKFGIQLVDDALYINVRGIIKGVKLRFGDNPAQALRLSSRIEKKVGSIIIKNSEFQKALRTNRLRTEVLTYSRLDRRDINLTGAPAVVKFIKSGCNATTTVAVPKSKPQTSSSNSHSHNGRTHSHPLPSQGKAHRHGNGAVGK